MTTAQLAEDVTTRAYDALMAAGERALADELSASQALRDADIATIADAAAKYAESILDNIESMRENDEDRVTDQAEHDEICAALNRLNAAKECDECHEAATEFYPNLKKSVQLCDSCAHNARRSGWEPGR